MIILQAVCVTSGFAYLHIDNASGQLEQYVVLYFFLYSRSYMQHTDENAVHLLPAPRGVSRLKAGSEDRRL